jgi:hypothetical protein
VPVVAGIGQAVGGAAGNALSGAAAAAGGVASGIGQAVTGLAGFGINTVFTASSEWVASGAVWLLGQVGHAMSASTTVELGTQWFAAHEAVMASLAAAIVLPMACCAALQAVYHQSASMLTRSFLVHLPLALLLTGVAVELVQTALRITDALSSDVLASAGVDTTNILAPVSEFLAQAGPAGAAAPGFVVFVGGILVAVGALGLWLELVVRAAAVTAATLFLPLTLAALVWPAVAHWCRRLADTLAALILSKLVIAAVLSLAVGALAGGIGGGSANGGGGGFAAVVTGIALLLVATLSPFTLLKLVPAVEAGAAAHVESTRHRLTGAARAPLNARNLALDVARDATRRPPGATLEAGDVGSAAMARPHVPGTALSPTVGPAFAAGVGMAEPTGGTTAAPVVGTDAAPVVGTDPSGGTADPPGGAADRFGGMAGAPGGGADRPGAGADRPGRGADPPGRVPDDGVGRSVDPRAMAEGPPVPDPSGG